MHTARRSIPLILGALFAAVASVESWPARRPQSPKKPQPKPARAPVPPLHAEAPRPAQEAKRRAFKAPPPFSSVAELEAAQEQAHRASLEAGNSRKGRRLRRLAERLDRAILRREEGQG